MVVGSFYLLPTGTICVHAGMFYYRQVHSVHCTVPMAINIIPTATYFLWKGIIIMCTIFYHVCSIFLPCWLKMVTNNWPCWSKPWHSQTWFNVQNYNNNNNNNNNSSSSSSSTKIAESQPARLSHLEHLLCICSGTFRKMLVPFSMAMGNG